MGYWTNRDGQEFLVFTGSRTELRIHRSEKIVLTLDCGGNQDFGDGKVRHGERITYDDLLVFLLVFSSSPGVEIVLNYLLFSEIPPLL